MAAAAAIAPTPSAMAAAISSAMTMVLFLRRRGLEAVLDTQLQHISIHRRRNVLTCCSPMSSNCTDSLPATCSCTAREMQMPPTCASPRRAAMLTPSPRGRHRARHVADCDADAEIHLPARRIGEVAGAQALLDVDRAAHRLDRARELGRTASPAVLTRPPALAMKSSITAR